jgi:hypothetical protein
VKAYRRAIANAPDYAEAHCNLGKALQRQGRFAQGLAFLKRGHALGSKRPGWPYPSAAWVRQAHRLAELEARLPALRQGDSQPRDPADRLALAGVCLPKRLYLLAARLYAEALDAEPKWAEDVNTGNRYNAACAAARAGSGQGRDAGKLDDKERARWRGRALEWLRAELTARDKQLQGRLPGPAAQAQQALRHWQRDPDLASVRDREALAKLPEAERAKWQQLWAEVAAALKKAPKQPAAQGKN